MGQKQDQGQARSEDGKGFNRFTHFDIETDSFAFSPTGRRDPRIEWKTIDLPSYLQDHTDRSRRQSKSIIAYYSAILGFATTPAFPGPASLTGKDANLIDIDFSWLEERYMGYKLAGERPWDYLDKHDFYAATYGDKGAFNHLYMQQWDPAMFQEHPADRTAAERRTAYLTETSRDILSSATKGEFYDQDLPALGSVSADRPRTVEPDTSRVERSRHRPQRY